MQSVRMKWVLTHKSTAQKLRVSRMNDFLFCTAVTFIKRMESTQPAGNRGNSERLDLMHYRQLFLTERKHQFTLLSETNDEEHQLQWGKIKQGFGFCGRDNTS